MMKGLIFVLVLFAIDPASQRVVLTKGTGHVQIEKVSRAIYRGKEVSLQKLLTESLSREIHVIHFDGNMKELTVE
jgi:hypothetical protein